MKKILPEMSSRHEKTYSKEEAENAFLKKQYNGKAFTASL
jgi:hypothetical protein